MAFAESLRSRSREPTEGAVSRGRSAAPSMITANQFQSALQMFHAGQPSSLNPPPGLPSSQEILLQLLQAQTTQNQLMAQQLALAQQSQRSELNTYTKPDEILASVEPGLRDVLAQWAKDYKSTLQHYFTQKSLQQKYGDLQAAGDLHKQFQTEAQKTWQWPATFKPHAKKLAQCLPTLTENQQEPFQMTDDSSTPFDIDQAFTELRQRHAQECHNFVLAYQRQCVAYFEREVHVTLQRIKLEDLLTSWFVKYAGVLSEDARTSMRSLAMQFADVTFRTEQPRAMERHEKDRAQKQKQREELLKAEAEYRLMDVNKLLATAVLEFGALQSQSYSANRQSKLPKDGALAFLSKQYPELAKKYNLVVSKKDHRDSNKNPKPSTRSRSASRASSTKSARNSSTKSKAVKKPHGHRSTSRKSATSSKASSRNRSNPKKGSGKGKGKGKGKGPKRQASKSVRIKTPAPPRRS